MKLKVVVLVLIALGLFGVQFFFSLGQPALDTSLAFEQAVNPSVETSTLMRNSNSLDVGPYLVLIFGFSTIAVFSKELGNGIMNFIKGETAE